MKKYFEDLKLQLINSSARRTYGLFYSFLCLVILSFSSCNYGEDVVSQPEVKIGIKTWSTRNLSVEKFANGDPIMEATTIAEWNAAAASGKPAWCYYDFDPVYEKVYGKLYNWYTVADNRGLCPTGWHIPTDDEWRLLSAGLDEVPFNSGSLWYGCELVAGKHWGGHKESEGCNKSGFSSLPAGSLTAEFSFWSNQFVAEFEDVDELAAWWSTNQSTEHDAECELWHKKGEKSAHDAIVWSVGGSNLYFSRKTFHKSSGISVRCVED